MLLNYMAVVIDVALMFLITVAAYKDKNWNKNEFAYFLFFMSYVMNIAALLVKW